jgi:hypothetical protein
VFRGHRQLLFRFTATLISALQPQHIDFLGISTVRREADAQYSNRHRAPQAPVPQKKRYAWLASLQ